jgi:hypothetical protein
MAARARVLKASSARLRPSSAALLLMLALVPVEALAAPPQEPGSATLRVTVRDPTGAVIVGAAVSLGRQAVRPEISATTDARGEATLPDVPAGRWTLRVASPGFEDHSTPELLLKRGRNRVDVTLRLAGVSEQVTVGLDPAEGATNPAGNTLTLTLGQRELDALPDSEQDLQTLLSQLAGPDAEITVDGFVDGDLPPRSRIQEIRIQRGLYSADRRRGGRSRVEIVTRPGMEDWRGDVSFGFRDDALDARNAFATADTPEQLRRFAVSVQGPVVRNRTSVSVDVEGISAFESNTIRAASPQGLVSGLVRQPEESFDVTVGLHHALTPLQSLRLEYRHESGDRENLGVGGFDLEERAYTRRTTHRRLRIASVGTIAAAWLNETRVQLQWDDALSAPLSQQPTVRVLDAVTFGGASVRGGRLERQWQLDQKLERSIGRHHVVVGGRFEWARFESDEIADANGVFTFTSLAALEAAQPSTFHVRQGDPALRYGMFHGGLFVQDDVRLRKNLLLSGGLRQDWQSHVGNGWNPAPRIGLSWSDSTGKVAVRAGLGLFNEWFEAGTYEETLQVDGTRVQDITIEEPGYPDPLTGGALTVLPGGRVQRSPGLELPLQRQGTVALEQQLGTSVRVSISYSVRDAIRQLRGRNLNAPGPDGIRPDSAAGNVIEIQSIGRSRENEVTIGGHVRLPWRTLFVAARYTYENERDDGDGPTSLPASNVAPDEWGPASDDVRHRASVFVTMEPVANLRLGATLRSQSAPPYTITTGRDDNGDAEFNDRPVGLARNSARAAGATRLDMRLAWRLGLGEGRPAEAEPRGGNGWSSEHRVMTELFLSATNVLNSVHPVRFSGVLTSPFFSRATAAESARRIEVGTRVMF